MRVIVWGIVGDCIYLVTGKVTPNDADFKPYLEFVRANTRADSKPRVLVKSNGPGLSAKQRQELNELTAPFAKVARIAVLTDSAVGRGVVTAMAWFAKEVYQAFPLADVNGAFEFLQVPQGLQAELRKALWAADTEVMK